MSISDLIYIQTVFITISCIWGSIWISASAVKSIANTYYFIKLKRVHLKALTDPEWESVDEEL